MADDGDERREDSSETPFVGTFVGPMPHSRELVSSKLDRVEGLHTQV